MKNLYFFAIFSLISNSIFGQKNGPTKGDWVLSSNASSLLNYAGNLFNGSAESPEISFQNEEMSLLGKLFINDSTAWRGGVNVQMLSKTTDLLLGEAPYTTKESSYSLTISLGKEFRKGRNRLQGFYGYGSHIMVSTNSYEDGISEGEEENSDMGIGINTFVGAEYFFRPKMSLGAEYRHGISYQESDNEKSFSISGQTTAIFLSLYF
tara:strand:- start:183 stop:806 length:624 start_codon:yes stop_codon:yes gene_type:complete